MFSRRYFFLIGLVFLTNSILVIHGNGTLFVGFLGYSNPTNRRFDGECCDLQTNTSTCTDFCDLIFEVSVQGIESLLVNGKRPSENPIGTNDVILFPSAYEGVINPVSFDFKKWPGKVNITIDVYDQDAGNSLQLVDRFVFPFEPKEPSMDYMFMVKRGQRKSDHSELKMIFRYSCDPTYYGNDCGTDCLFQGQSKACPGYQQPSGTPQSITDWIYLLTTQKALTTRRCSTLDSTRDGQVNESSNCTHEATSPTTENSVFTETPKPEHITDKTTGSEHVNIKTVEVTDETYTTTSSIDVTSLPVDETTAFYNTENEQSTESTDFTSSTREPSMTTLSVDNKRTTIDKSNTNNAMVKSSTMPSTELVTVVSATTSNVNQGQLQNSTNSENETRESNNREQPNTGKSTLTPKPPLNTSTVRDENGNKNDDGGVMSYWPAIVGGVLGGLALIAGVGIFLYFKKQKARQHRRQDIYNVNPKTWALEPQENGTSGKSEVALETEPV